ncbi:MAG: phage tail assembly chaperone [Hoeflea sp.]|uniref:rcc01693 family protein n=1 Tax=Hoeflea sp. TaxID=1940281 RepID=UPI0032EB204B
MTKGDHTPFPWASVIRFGLGRLRLAPEAFWALSLPELAALISAEANPGHASRDDLEALMARFPDREGRAVNENLSRRADRNHGDSDATLPPAELRSTDDG